MDQREYDQIEEIIAAEENRVEQLQKKMELPEIVSNPEELAQCWQESGSSPGRSGAVVQSLG